MAPKDALLAAIQDRSGRIAVVGLGYVGLPLAVAFAEKGFRVVGIDADQRKVDALNSGKSYVEDISSERLALITAAKPTEAPLQATSDYAMLDACAATIIAVPTPLGKSRDPDMRYVVAAGEAVAQHIHVGMLVSLESTTYPGTTEELLRPMLEARWPARGRRLFLGLFARAH